MAVVPIAVALVVGLIAGTVRGGRAAGFSRTRFRSVGFLLVAVALAVLGDVVDLPNPLLWAVAGLLAGLAFTLSNLRLVGMSIVAVGIVVNLVPIVANGAMPVRGDALVAAGMVEADELDRVGFHGARELADGDTVVEFLGDIIPLSVTGQVLSFGDLIMLVGLADVIANLMLQTRSRRHSVDRTPRRAGGAAVSIELFDEAPDERLGFDDLYDDADDAWAMTSANADHDWGTAPPPEPVSASQYSASPDAAAPATVVDDTNSATVAVAERPAANHNR